MSDKDENILRRVEIPVNIYIAHKLSTGKRWIYGKDKAQRKHLINTKLKWLYNYNFR